MPNRVSIVFDINVLVNAFVATPAWPVVPPTTANPAADCVGVVNDGDEFALWLSPHILGNTSRVVIAAGASTETGEAYADLLVDIATASGGGVVDPPRTVHDCPDHEDNLILDLAASRNVVLVVSDDTDLTAMSPWRGIPILRSREFASRVDVTRRNR